MASSAERRHHRHRSSVLARLAFVAALSAAFVACGNSSESGSDVSGSSDDTKGRFIPVEAAAQPPLPPGAGPAPPGPDVPPPSDAATPPTDAAPTDSAITDATGQ